MQALPIGGVPGYPKAMTQPRLAARAVIVRDGALLLVNAYPDGLSDLWCAPGGGVEAGQSLHGNLVREVFEETGLTIHPGALIHVSEFHEPASGFHQVELFFAATIADGALDEDWRDPEAIVTERRYFTQAELAAIRYKPDILPRLAFQPCPALSPGALETKAP